MPTCPRCGAGNPHDARFCNACGSTLEVAAAEGRRPEVRKTVTVLFCDVVDSTRIAERHDPEQLRHLMSRYYEAATAVLKRHGGTVET